MRSPVLLEKLQVGLMQDLSADLLDVSVDVDETAKAIMGNIVLQVHGTVWAENESVRRQVVSYPHDWWQAVRERWLPAWMLKRWPIVYKDIVLDVKAIYPNFRPAVPGERVVLHIMRED